jgi:hypothetical protein
MSNGVVGATYPDEQEPLVVERTTPQVFIAPGNITGGQLINPDRQLYRTYRLMRKDPTIAFARMLCVAPLITAGWAYKQTDYAPEGALEFIKNMFEPHRVRLMKTAMEGYIDFGWSPYEMVKKCDEWGWITIEKFKPLIQMYTDILIDGNNGEYIGLRQQQGNAVIDLSIYDSMCFTFDVEGTFWYGQALMENARAPYNAWNNVEQASERYDNKIAGSHWVIHYPVGQSPFRGKLTDNETIAENILASLESSGKIAVPTKVAAFVDDLNAQNKEDAWKIEILSDSGSARAQFTDRCKYLDALKVRAFGFPERAILEGQFGTKAESESQADFAICNVEVRHTLITQQISQQAVNLVLELNYGVDSRDTVTVEPNPLSDDKIAFFRELFLAIMKDPNTAASVLQGLDMQQLWDKLGLPAASYEDMYGVMQNPGDEFIDPNTGYPIDPNTGMPYDPSQMTYDQMMPELPYPQAV